MTIVEFITARVDEDHARATAVIESLRRDGASTGLAYDGDLATWHRDDNYRSEGTGVYTSLLSITEPDHTIGAFDGVHMVIYSGDGKPSYEVAGHITAEDPAATLRRCAMIRAIMRHATKARQLDEEIEQSTKSSGAAISPAEPWIDEQIHRDIAAYWNTHPDYRKEWANG